MQAAGAMDRDRSALLPSLRDMFPTMPDDVLAAALDAYSNDVEHAIGALLEMCAESHDASALTGTTGGVARGNQPHSSPKVKVEGKNKARPISGNSSGSGKHPTSSSSATPSRTQDSNSRPRRAGAGQPLPPSRTTTWGQLRTDQQQLQTQGPQHQQLPHQSYGAPPGHWPNAAWPLGQASSGCQSPKYVVPGAAAGIRLGATDFPDLPQAVAAEAAGAAGGSRGPRLTPAAVTAAQSLPVARSSSTTIPSYSTGSLHDLAQQVGSLSFTSVSGSGRGAAATAALPLPPSPLRRVQGDTPFGYADVARHVPPLQQPPARPEVGSWAWLAGQGDVYGAGNVYGAADAPAAADEGWQAAALEELSRSHPWAGSDLVEAVCLALQYDLTEVVSALDELNAASYQYDDSGGGDSGSAAASSVSNSNYPAASSSDDDNEDEDEARGNPSLIPRHGRAAAAAAESYDFSAHRANLAGRVDGVSAASGGAGSCRRSRRDEPSESSDGTDAYSRHRGSALKLTHAWRKQMGKASAAFAAGDRALGRRLVAEAQAVRRQAAAAHQQAAERIVEEMNEGRQLSRWELDLHGLHVQEAVQVLAKRIAALEPKATSPASAAATITPVSLAPLHNNGAGGASARNRTPPPQQQRHRAPDCDAASPAVAADVSAAARLLASRRVLRVIVGKGLHSSGREASLPRVVESYLLARGYRFTPHAGVIEVQLRRHYAVNPPAVAPVVVAAPGTAAGGPAATHRRPR